MTFNEASNMIESWRRKQEGDGGANKEYLIGYLKVQLARLIANPNQLKADEVVNCIKEDTEDKP